MGVKKCPACHNDMQVKKINKKTTFRDIEITYPSEAYVCEECGLEAGTIKQASAVQKVIAECYRKKTGLLTGDEIRTFRKEKGLSQKQLADEINVGIASIKRWETGLIQSKSMDHALRVHLQNHSATDKYTGNRDFSIERVKLVIHTFEITLNKKLLKKTDKLLYSAKYLWYADMICFRDFGKSMTGSTYAALPYGPQLNNYKDLIGEIINADETLTDPLSTNETGIIKKICDKFPTEKEVYEAAHQEKIWKQTSIGAIIPYTSSNEITSF